MGMRFPFRALWLSRATAMLVTCQVFQAAPARFIISKLPDSREELHSWAAMVLARALVVCISCWIWYGSTVTKEGAPFFSGPVRYHTFLSVEPLLEPLNAGLGSFGAAEWIIVGAMTGPGSENHQPRREWVENIVEAASITHAPVFMKGNLAEVWGPDLSSGRRWAG